MANDKYLYHYRKSKKHYVDDFCNDSITSSRYDAFPDQGELNLSINKEAFLKYKIPSERVDGFLNAILNNCLLNYFMACFSKTDPFSDRYVKDEFSGQDGFCLVYTYPSIENKTHVLFNNKITELLPVHYDDRPYDVTPIVSPIADIVMNNQHLNEKDLDKLIDDYSKNKTVSTTLGPYVVNAFVHKKKDHWRENEVRLVMQRPKGLSKLALHPEIIKAIPVMVYMSRKLLVFYQHRIIEHCRELVIPYEYYKD